MDQFRRHKLRDNRGILYGDDSENIRYSSLDFTLNGIAETRCIPPRQNYETQENFFRRMKSQLELEDDFYQVVHEINKTLKEIGNFQPGQFD